MTLQFWGVRGSIPSPANSENLESKIQAIVNSITPEDLINQDAKQSFIISLSDKLTSYVGGNTACVSIQVSDEEIFILDVGTGIRELGKKLPKTIKKIHIFLTHFHWDHIQGLPFFDPIFKKDTEIHFYSPDKNLKKFLTFQMSAPFFPVEFSNCGANFKFHNLELDKSFAISGVYVKALEISHPNRAYSYLFNLKNGKKILYATDFEISLKDFEDTDENKNFFSNTDIMIIDSQYTAPEYYVKEHWGHSPYCYSVDFGHHYNCKNLYLFHHDPIHDDNELYEILDKAKTYSKKYLKSKMNIFLAKEGNKIDLGD